jgi:hypothetical protein
MRNIFDLARYLLPTPPVPARWRRRMMHWAPASRRAHLLDLDRGGIRSGAISHPARVERMTEIGISRFRRQEILHIRHYSLYARPISTFRPISPSSPTLEEGFSYKGLTGPGSLRGFRPGQRDVHASAAGGFTPWGTLPPHQPQGLGRAPEFSFSQRAAGRRPAAV